jgi:acetoin utilization protein AcuB
VLNLDILSADIPYLNPEDSVLLAKDIMVDHHVAHLPVVSENKLLGIIDEDSLLDAPSDDSSMNSLQTLFSHASVQGIGHILDTLHICSEFQLTLVPVLTEESDYLGSISALDLIRHTDKIVGAGDPGAIIVLEMDRVNFAFSEIIKLVETNDAQVTQLNTYTEPGNSSFFITLRINKMEVSDIIATFQRYEYKIKYYFGEEQYENELRSNYNHLMNYLSI